MGTTQSKDESQFEKVLDLFCACACQPIISKSNKATAASLNWKFPASSHFNLNLLHPSLGPYLGTSMWEPLALDDDDDDDDENDTDNDDILNISHHAAADQEFQPLSHSSPITTPPRCVNLNTSHEHALSPSFLLQKTSSFSSPRIRWTQTQESASANSNGVSSVRTGTTTSTEDCHSSIKGGAEEVEEDLKITLNSCSFAPRKLFDHEHEHEYRRDHGHGHGIEKKHEVGPLHSHNPKGQATMYACMRSRILTGANSQTLPPPPPPPRWDNSSPSISIDQSIMMRNGVLVHTSTCASQTMQLSSTSPKSTITCHNINLSPSRVSNRHTPDGLERNNMLHVNTLPSFKDAHPIRLKIKESYQGYETQNVQPQEQEGGDYGIRSTGTGAGNGRMALEDMNASNLSILSDAEQACFFSYDPYFSLGQYLISTLDGGQYGNGLSVKMGERYMTLQDRHERVWGVMRSRHTWIPSAVIYSPKPRYPSQTPSSHRPSSGGMDMGGNLDKDGVELYPWALVKKHGRRMDHDVTIHMVVDKKEVGVGGSSARNMNHNNARGDLVGGLFDKKPMFRSRHGFDGWDNHQHTVVYRINKEDQEVPSCIMVRDPIQRDVFDITIAPGIDPLLIICYMAVHSKMVSTVHWKRRDAIGLTLNNMHHDALVVSH